MCIARANGTLNSHRQKRFKSFFFLFFSCSSFSFHSFFPTTSPVNFIMRFRSKRIMAKKKNFQFTVEIAWRLNYVLAKNVHSDWIKWASVQKMHSQHLFEMKWSKFITAETKNIIRPRYTERPLRFRLISFVQSNWTNVKQHKFAYFQWPSFK